MVSLQALRPLNAYGWSKALFDIYAVREAHRGHAPAQWAGLKFFNVYGPNEDHKGGMKSVVAQIWPRIAAGEGVKLFKSHHPDYEDGGQLRDFVYVRDAVDVIAWLAKSPAVNGVFNLGSGHARSFRTWPWRPSRPPGASRTSPISTCPRCCAASTSTTPRRT
jgi:ADP-L-glycero-D-manno-heptose 6-epimerase